MGIYVSEPFKRFIREQVETGHYATESDVVEAALVHLEEELEEEELRQLVAEAMKGYERGEFIEWTPGHLQRLGLEAEEAARRDDPIPGHVKP